MRHTFSDYCLDVIKYHFSKKDHTEEDYKRILHNHKAYVNCVEVLQNNDDKDCKKLTENYWKDIREFNMKYPEFVNKRKLHSVWEERYRKYQEIVIILGK